MHDDAYGYVIEHPFVARVIYEAIGPGRRQERYRRADAAVAAYPGEAAAPRPISASGD